MRKTVLIALMWLWLAAPAHAQPEMVLPNGLASTWVWWFLAALVLLMLELMTGTFYLLVVAFALAAGGTASVLGASLVAQLLAAGAAGAIGVMWLRRIRRLANRETLDVADALQNIDVNHIVRVNDWTALNTTRVAYRGASWEAELAPGETPEPGEFVIAGLRANRLVLARSPR